MPPNEAKWRALRAGICLRQGVTNLNAGSCSPTARTALERALGLMREQAEDPVHFVFRTAPAGLERARRALAGYLRCEASRLALIPNTSYGVSLILKSLKWRDGDEVVTTDQEYHHYDALWRRLTKARGIVLRRVHIPLTGESRAASAAQITDAFAAAMTPRTRALFFSHVTSNTGTALPAAALSALARAHGVLTIIDGAHAPGLVDLRLGSALDADALGCDFYLANMHKWMMGAAGSAFMYAAPERRAQIEPLVTMEQSEYAPALADTPVHAGEFASTHWAVSHEYQGTRNMIPSLVMPEAIAFRTSLTEADLQERTRSLAKQCEATLANLGYTLVSPVDPQLATCMRAFRLPVGTPKIDTGRAWVAMRERHDLEIAMPALATGEPLLRVSCAWFNDVQDLERLESVLGAWRWTNFAV